MGRKVTRLRSVWHKGLVESYSSVTLRATLSSQTTTYQDTNERALCTPVTPCFTVLTPRPIEEKNGSQFRKRSVIPRLDNHGNGCTVVNSTTAGVPRDVGIIGIASSRFGGRSDGIHFPPPIMQVGFSLWHDSILPSQSSTKVYDGSFPAIANRSIL